MRLAAVLAILWFGYWGIRGFKDYSDWWRYSESSTFWFDISTARDAYYQDWIMAVGIPAGAAAAILVIRWVWRGFFERTND